MGTSRRVLVGLCGAVAWMLLVASPIAAAVNRLEPAGWPVAEQVARCRAVIQEAVAEYEEISADLVVDGSAFRLDLVSARPFPSLVLEGKLCLWQDANANGRLDPAEEQSLRVAVGSIEWPAGASTGSVSGALGGQSGLVCARLWFYARYDDGELSTKRSSVACTTAPPPPVVSEIPVVALLGATGAATLSAAALLRRRVVGRPRPTRG